MTPYEILNNPKEGYDNPSDFIERTQRALAGDTRTFNKDAIDTAFFERSLLPYLSEILERKSTVKLLEAGCGYGRHIPFLQSYVDYYVAVEPCPDRIAYAKQHHSYPNVTFVKGPVQDYRTQRRFQLIWMCNVIQHLPISSKLAVLTNLHRLLTYDGTLLLFEGKILEASLEDCASFYLDEKCPSHTIPCPMQLIRDEFADCHVERLAPPALIRIRRKK